MNIAIIVTFPNQSGGAFQYELFCAKLFSNTDEKKFKFIFYCNSKKVQDSYKKNNININLININIFQKFYDSILKNKFFNYLLISLSHLLKRPKLKIFHDIRLNFYSNIENRLNKDNIDIVYFTSPSDLYKQIRNIPFIFTVFDLNFLSYNYFPELSQDNIFLNRNKLYYPSLNRAYKIIVCSKILKKQIIQSYNIPSDRIEIFHYLPNKKNLNEKHNFKYSKKYNLNSKYIFYPATFYPHKNHMYVLKVLKYINDNYKKNIIVNFVGSNPGIYGNLNLLKKIVKEYKLTKNVIFNDFVEDEAIPYFYKNAICLLMPSFTGPNNIPPLEAIIYDCPVLYSDLQNFHEQFNKLVEYINLNDPSDAAKKIISLDSSKLKRSKIIETQIKYFDYWNEQKFEKKLIKILNDYEDISKNWKDYD